MSKPSTEKLQVPESSNKYFSSAEELVTEANDMDTFVLSVGKYLRDHFNSFESVKNPNSILESRFTPPDEAFDQGLKSCGTRTNIAAEMLRHVGYEVEKVHGSIPQSPDHAWIAVKLPEGDSWKEYDLTKENGEITADHKEIARCQDWEDIRDIIETAHNVGEQDD